MFIRIYGHNNKYLGHSATTWLTVREDVADAVAYSGQWNTVTHVTVQVNGKVVKTITADAFVLYCNAS
jgi:hypothetical protein